jgi:hypothetical protein
MHTTFRQWAKRQFCIIAGIHENSFEHWIGWGVKKASREQAVVVPNYTPENFDKIAPKMGMNGNKPWLTWTDAVQAPPYEIVDGVLIFHFDVISALGWILAGYEEVLHSSKRDGFGRWAEGNSLLAKHDLTRLPIINIWMMVVRNAITGKGGKPETLWPEGKRFAVALTHDVDNPYYATMPHIFKLIHGLLRPSEPNNFQHSIIKVAGSLVILAKDRFKSPKGFTKALERDIESGFKSTVFVIPTAKMFPYSQVNDPIYTLNHSTLQASLHMARENGIEIGLHTLMNTAPHADRYREQREFLAQHSQQDIISNRHHYWNISRRDTAGAFISMAESGFKFDSSVAFYDRINFRRSTAWPYHGFSPQHKCAIDIIEIPPSFMDEWMDASDPAGKAVDYLDSVADYCGVAVLNWHDKCFNNRHFQHYGQAYIQIIKHLETRDDVWVATISEIGEWWKQRSDKLFDGGK